MLDISSFILYIFLSHERFWRILFYLFYQLFSIPSTLKQALVCVIFDSMCMCMAVH